ncbi:MAG: hypothetical protein IJ868_07975 [Prevotella sp.]|nr:hypothetical protein [Prevotella sp.]
MRRLLPILMGVLMMLTTVGCRRYLYRPPVYRPVDFVPDSLVHDDVKTAEDENNEMLEEIEDEPLMSLPDIPQESDLLQDENRDVDVEKIMKEGI